MSRFPSILFRRTFSLNSSFHSTSKQEQIFSLFRTFATAQEIEKDPVLKRIEKDVESSPCVVYMKGQPHEPACRFSAAVVQILNLEGAQFQSFNVLEDSDLRESIKKFSDWPTIPQVFLKGKFIGGCDIMIDLYKKGELKKMLKEADVPLKSQE